MIGKYKEHLKAKGVGKCKEHLKLEDRKVQRTP